MFYTGIENIVNGFREIDNAGFAARGFMRQRATRRVSWSDCERELSERHMVEGAASDVTQPSQSMGLTLNYQT